MASPSDKIAEESSVRKAKSAWHYTPELPVNTSPCFKWPLNFPQIGKWIFNGWFPVSERMIILLLAIVSSAFFQPTVAEAQSLSPGWIIEVLMRNLVLMIFVAGGLHWYFYIARRQGDERRYDKRPFATSSRVFTFGTQVRDNMFWSLASGVTVWTLYEWETTHFFLIHRLIHTSKIYQRVHALHHRNTNVGPWSGLSMHPIEHVVYLSTVLVHFIVPSTPFLVAFHLMYFTLSAATTHTGYQGIVFRGNLLLPLGTFHHQLHHRYFTCNYGGLEMPWDQWTGSFHNGTEESHQKFIADRKQKISR